MTKNQGSHQSNGVPLQGIPGSSSPAGQESHDTPSRGRSTRRNVNGTLLILNTGRREDRYAGLRPDGMTVRRVTADKPYSLSGTEQADVMLLDCGSDVDKGIMMLSALKTAWPATPVIFLSDVMCGESVLQAFRCGARDYYGHPLDIGRLQETIERVFCMRRWSKEKRVPVSALSSTMSPGLLDNPCGETPGNILDTIRFIRDNYAEEICLDELSRMANLSKYHYCRLFKKYTGVSPKKFLNRVRIDRARQLLTGKDATVSMVAAEVGYNDLSNFINNFKKISGVTPSSFRKFVRPA